MAYEEISASRRRYLRIPTDTVVEATEPVVALIRPAEAEFVCEACRRELPLTERSRVKVARCRACA
jgi:hypothetical protein